ncbi:thiamine biosynthesis protein ThiS [Aerococcus christensenii]|uniref:Thiamine biosynthesis protein ThiS n=1 Tax=Aerococcus christensenii TaxID=87541 RepID=A0A2I1K6N1_9LACT|nr:sulfur carrier protein ThiS [Aerococcus christensenii]PKY91247.1 thiamine biosynthesis protein ThiS [Aerococcus christensenii]
MLKINKQWIDYHPGENLLQVLERADYSPDFVAVEVNGDLIKRKEFQTLLIPDEAVIEVFTIVGGG